MDKRAHATLSLAIVLAGLALTPPSAHAAVVFGSGYAGTVAEVFSTTALAYQADASNSDLLNGIAATNVAGWNLTNDSTVAELNDGIHGTDGVPVAGAWTTVGATATYAFGSGYDLASIQSIAAWSGGGLGQQAWSIEVRPVGGSFETLATINYQPLSSPTRIGGATKVTLSNLNATNIDAIRVTANAVNSNNNFVWKELDVFAVPEPSAAVLLGLFGGLTLLRRRR